MKTVELLIEEEVEKAIRLKSPDKMPLNPTAQGWTGAEIRRQLAKSILDANDSIFAELKNKLAIIKENFEEVEDQYNEIVARVQALAVQSLEKLIHFGIEPPLEPQPAGGYWFKVTGVIE